MWSVLSGRGVSFEAETEVCFLYEKCYRKLKNGGPECTLIWFVQIYRGACVFMPLRVIKCDFQRMSAQNVSVQVDFFILLRYFVFRVEWCLKVIFAFVILLLFNFLKAFGGRGKVSGMPSAG